MFLRKINNREYVGYILRIGYYKSIKNLSDPCQQNVTHPILGHTRKIKSSCIIKGGNIVGPYVLYNTGSSSKDTIITLGGSTTDGFFTIIIMGFHGVFILQRI